MYTFEKKYAFYQDIFFLSQELLDNYALSMYIQIPKLYVSLSQLLPSIKKISNKKHTQKRERTTQIKI